mmetsp:Transcript_8962/g.19021  ORF Transcript_8962/g.19021 Transcript_8962/m.19021 type:complete len:158 (+) Transcript_8962:463-936(+)
MHDDDDDDDGAIRDNCTSLPFSSASARSRIASVLLVGLTLASILLLPGFSSSVSSASSTGSNRSGVLVSDSSTRGSSSSSSKSRMLAFAVNPTLSDRSLEKILEVLPVDKDLHGRPTGQVVVGGRERTNIDGDMDEIDFCQQVLREAFGGLKLCCPR